MITELFDVYVNLPCDSLSWLNLSPFDPVHNKCYRIAFRRDSDHSPGRLFKLPSSMTQNWLQDIVTLYEWEGNRGHIGM